jgi:arsenate reductase (thioredoxin)
MEEILFLCQHGGAKSVIAVSHFNRLAAERGLPFVAAAAAAEDPYEAVPAPVADHLQREGFDVRAFKPRQAEPGEISSAARVVTIGCEVPGAQGGAAVSERWDDVPAASEDLEGSVAAIRRHVEALAATLAADLDGDR